MKRSSFPCNSFSFESHTHTLSHVTICSNDTWYRNCKFFKSTSFRPKWTKCLRYLVNNLDCQPHVTSIIAFQYIPCNTRSNYNTIKLCNRTSEGLFRITFGLKKKMTMVFLKRLIWCYLYVGSRSLWIIKILVLDPVWATLLQFHS